MFRELSADRHRISAEDCLEIGEAGFDKAACFAHAHYHTLRLRADSLPGIGKLLLELREIGRDCPRVAICQGAREIADFLFDRSLVPAINRTALGFSAERDMANPGRSGTKRKALAEELRAAISTEVNSDILPKLHDRFQGVLGKHGWELAPSKDENKEMTLLFHYPNAFEYSKYLQPQIKIELGRGDQQPSGKSSVTPFVADMFPGRLSREGSNGARPRF